MISLILNGRAMKKLFGLFAALALVCASCSKYDDSALKDRLDALDERIEVLNQRLQALNENVSALGVLAQAYAAGSYVTGITEVRDQDSNLTGYKVSFTNLEPVTIHTGQDGADGYIGSDGTPGTDGTPGHSPVVGVVQENGIWYWTVDGTVLTDTSGAKIPASPDPSAAQAKDGETPRISVENGKWVVTTGDNKVVWGDVAASDVLVVDGVFASVDASGDDVVFTLSDGSVITLPVYKAFALTLSAGSGFSVNWSVGGAKAAVRVDVFTDSEWKASVNAESGSSGSIALEAPVSMQDASFLVLASDGIGEAAASFSIIDGNIVL